MAEDERLRKEIEETQAYLEKLQELDIYTDDGSISMELNERLSQLKDNHQIVLNEISEKRNIA